MAALAAARNADRCAGCSSTVVGADAAADADADADGGSGDSGGTHAGRSTEPSASASLANSAEHMDTSSGSMVRQPLHGSARARQR
jgi:hypothetical protein